MARIEGVDLPRNKRMEIGLTYIYGIGPSRAREILRYTEVSPDTRVKDLTDSDVVKCVITSARTTRLKVTYVAKCSCMLSD